MYRPRRTRPSGAPVCGRRGQVRQLLPDAVPGLVRGGPPGPVRRPRHIVVSTYEAVVYLLRDQSCSDDGCCERAPWSTGPSSSLLVATSIATRSRPGRHLCDAAVTGAQLRTPKSRPVSQVAPLSCRPRSCRADAAVTCRFGPTCRRWWPLWLRSGCSAAWCCDFYAHRVADPGYMSKNSKVSNG